MVNEKPPWASAVGSQVQSLDSINCKFFLISENSVPTGVVWIQIEEWFTKKWSWRRLRSLEVNPKWEIDFWRYTWSFHIGDWVAETEDIDLTKEVYDSILRGDGDFASGNHPITLEILPQSEQYWALCEFFPSGDNDGVAPD